MAVYTIVATVKADLVPAEAAPDLIKNALQHWLDEHGLQLVPCSWAPDVDTIADCLQNERSVTVIDMNPPVPGFGPTAHFDPAEEN